MCRRVVNNLEYDVDFAWEVEGGGEGNEEDVGKIMGIYVVTISLAHYSAKKLRNEKKSLASLFGKNLEK